MSKQVSENEGLFLRTVRSLRFGWQDFGASTPHAPFRKLRPDLPDGDLELVRQQMRACLEGRGGEVSARARAVALGGAYLRLNATGRARFLGLLAREFDTDADSVAAAVEAFAALRAAGERKQAERTLREALEAPRRRLLTQFNALPDGVKFLVDMRAELLAEADEDAALWALEQDLKDLLTAWFDVDFLELRRITWHTPAATLEKLMKYEAVHEIRGWDDLKDRLDSDRRCFAFFHPRMTDEPLVFVEVALTDGIARSIHELLDETAPVVDPRSANTAIFYSISNAQRGLEGIGFGGFLIKRVVDLLSAEFDGLETFATLSPIPGFRRWLEARLAAGETALPDSEHGQLAALAGEVPDGQHPLAVLLDRPGWWRDARIAEALKKPLQRLCARYLTEAKRADGKTLDPVANFHLTNGARMERLNWLADTSARGIAQAAGMMINYVYEPKTIERNHESYTGEGRIPASSALRTLAKR